MEHIYTISYVKDGLKLLSYQIPSTSELNAAVRLGQIYGEAYPDQDVNINILKITKSGIAR